MRSHTGFTDLDWDDCAKIKEAIATNKDNKDEKNNPQEKSRQLKRKK